MEHVRTTSGTATIAGPVTGVAAVRRATDRMHRSLEEATALPRSLRTTDDVVGLLRRWRHLAHALEGQAGGHVDRRLTPVVEDDLALLGATATSPRATWDPVDAGEPAAELGRAWVALGARLGLASLGGPVTAVVGHALGTFTRHDPTPLRRVRDLLDAATPDAAGAAARAAVAAFELAGDVLRGPPWQEGPPWPA